MSGGHFDYNQSRIYDMAEDIEDIINNNESKEKDKWGEDIGYQFPPEIIKHFIEGVRALKIAHIYAQRIDWLVSGDDGEKAFLKRLAEDLKEIDEV